VESSREEANSPATYWLLSPEGKPLATIKTNLWILDVAPDFIFFGGVDKDGIPFIRVLKREAKEVEDLLYFQGNKNFLLIL
jgi:hypothetical protein